MEKEIPTKYLAEWVKQFSMLNICGLVIYTLNCIKGQKMEKEKKSPTLRPRLNGSLLGMGENSLPGLAIYA